MVKWCNSGIMNTVNRAFFHLSAKSNLHVLRFCIVVNTDWFEKFRALPYPISTKMNINHDLVAHIFQRLMSAIWLHVLFVSCFDWVTGLPVNFVIGQNTKHFVLCLKLLYQLLLLFE